MTAPKQAAGGVIWTVGHSSRSSDKLIELLRETAIERVVDLRSSPWSRRHPWHGREELERALGAVEIGYCWMGHALGGLRKEGFESYRQTASYREGIDALLALDQTRNVLFCAERDYRHCHRRFICDDLVARGLRVWHLLDPGVAIPHQLTLF